MTAVTIFRTAPASGSPASRPALRPGGRLAVFWNAFQPPAGLAEALAGIYRRVLPGAPKQIPPARQQELLAGIGAAIDAAGGSFTMHYTTVAVTAVRSR